uniref:Uncharacterized protein n=1 Tax=Tanacetum cinerariifolium TaxID=118510 RepID=A0A699IQB4_TANCI|nr:hypothetical protein [Tanacetum cinerariifolium]
MAELSFADSHNMVAFLGKSAKNVDFAEIVDFLNANPIRKGKDFSGTVTPLFSTMLIPQLADMGEGSRQPTNPQPTSTSSQPFNKEQITGPSSSQHKKTHRPRKAKRVTEIPQELVQVVDLGAKKPWGTDLLKLGEVQVSTADMEVNTASTPVTTTSVNITTAKPVTTASAPLITAGVSVSTAEPSSPPTITTTVIKDEDLTIA